MIKTVSLETARALKEAGFKQDSHWHWTPFNDPAGKEYSLWDFPHSDSNPFAASVRVFAAPTTDELLEELPSRVRLEANDYYLWITRIKDRTYEVRFSDWKHEGHLYEIFQNESLPEALAQMWLWLKQKGLISNG